MEQENNKELDSRLRGNDSGIRDEKAKKPFYKKWWFWVIILAILLIAIGYTKDWYDNKKRAASDSSKIQQIGPKPVLSLPFSAELAANSLNPMGETLAHPDTAEKKGGHPGIDFEWNKDRNLTPLGFMPKITASMDADVVKIEPDPGHPNEKIVRTAREGWAVDYAELESVNPSLKVGDKIKKGDYIGVPSHPIEVGEAEDKYRMIHWQFGYYDERYGAEPRLCPMDYFDSTSKALIEEIWRKTSDQALKTNAPEICNYIYKDKNK